MKLFGKISVLIILGSLNCSCWRLGSPEPSPGSSPAVYYRNNQGQDLLDPNVLGHFDQSIIMVSWVNPDGSVGARAPAISNYSYNPSIPFLPGGYSISLNMSLFKDNNGNSGIISKNIATVFIALNDSVRDTLVYNFSNGLTLQGFTVNKRLVEPPQNMNSYPPVFPVVITK